LQLAGKQALVMGLGTRQGGVGVTRYLVSQGAEVTVTDLGDEASLRPSLDALSDLPVRYRLGEHVEEDFDTADLIVRNPGVPFNSPWLQRARERGVPIEMEMSLFFRACPAPIIGITGTKGKTTTATLCAAILERFHPETVLAGNMGTSALNQLDRIKPDTPVVLELSSWQLEGLADYEMSPEIAVLTNISQDHLNRYASMEDYIEAKRHMTRFQRSEDWFIINRNDENCWESRKITQAQIVPFGELDESEDGAGLAGDLSKGTAHQDPAIGLHHAASRHLVVYSVTRGEDEDRVVDSRTSREGRAIRRRDLRWAGTWRRGAPPESAPC
jgi:UDP-N-acetylmuramoylalanine--D-glutamate ligase